MAGDGVSEITENAFADCDPQCSFSFKGFSKYKMINTASSLVLVYGNIAKVPTGIKMLGKESFPQNKFVMQQPVKAAVPLLETMSSLDLFLFQLSLICVGLYCVPYPNMIYS